MFPWLFYCYEAQKSCQFPSTLHKLVLFSYEITTLVFFCSSNQQSVYMIRTLHYNYSCHEICIVGKRNDLTGCCVQKTFLSLISTILISLLFLQNAQSQRWEVFGSPNYVLFNFWSPRLETTLPILQNAFQGHAKV